jgi:F-type H+-transporting ATPase subunit b
VADVQVDLVTVAAQLLNFALLVLLLRHFLYRRITDLIDARQLEIAERLEAAARARAEAEEEASRHRQLRQSLDEERDVLLARAGDEARERGELLLASARADVGRERAEWRHALRREQEAFRRDLREQAAAAMLAAVRRALRDLADVDLERRAVDTFRQRLEAAAGDDAVRAALAGAASCVIRSAIALDDVDRDRLAAIVRERLGVTTTPRFEQVPDLVLGLQLVAGDHVIGWSVSDYLAALEEAVDRHLALAAVEPVGASGPDGTPDRTGRAVSAWTEMT